MAGRNWTAAHSPITVRIGDWSSGLYFARLHAGRRTGFAPFVVRTRIVENSTRWPWIFAGTGLRAGDPFGHGGIEIDHSASSSPRNVTVLAEMPDLFGPRHTAQMSYYETAGGAKVFAAGAFTLGGARNPVSCHVLQHPCEHLAGAGT